MAEWLKKQAELEGEKEQRRAERLKRKLVEPKHHFTDPDYQQQCHELSERMEDSVLMGMQASSSGLVSAEAGPSTNPKKKKRFWRAGDIDLDTSEEEEEEDEEERPGPSHHTRPNAAGPSRSTPARPNAEPVSTGSEQPEPVSTSSDQPEPEPMSTGSDRAEPEPLTQEPQQTELQTDPQQTDPQQADPQQADPQQTDPQQTDPQQSSPQQVSPPPQQEAPPPPLDLEAAGSPEDLEVAGLDQLKEALRSRGLKCGGTLQERARRLFSVRGLGAEQIDPLLRPKTSAKGRK